MRTPNWLDLRLVAGVLLVLVSAAVGVLVVANAGSTRRVWALARTVNSGATLTPADLVPAQIRMTGSARLYLPADSADGVVGRAVNRPLAAGELLPRAALAGDPPTMTMTVPLTTDRAPKIARGQKITVWVSTKTCQARVVVAGVQVLEVDGAGGGSFGTSSVENVVVRLAPDEAARVITALDLDGAVVRAGVVAGDPGSAQPLTDCGASS